MPETAVCAHTPVARGESPGAHLRGEPPSTRTTHLTPGPSPAERGEMRAARTPRSPAAKALGLRSRHDLVLTTTFDTKARRHKGQKQEKPTTIAWVIGRGSPFDCLCFSLQFAFVSLRLRVKRCVQIRGRVELFSPLRWSYALPTTRTAPKRGAIRSDTSSSEGWKY